MYKMTASAHLSRAGSGARAPSPRGAEGRRAAGERRLGTVCAPDPGRDQCPRPQLALGQRAGVQRGPADRVASARPSWVKTVAAPRALERQRAGVHRRLAGRRPCARGGVGGLFDGERGLQPLKKKNRTPFGGGL